MEHVPIWCISDRCRNEQLADIDKVDPDQCRDCDYFNMDMAIYEIGAYIDRAVNIISQIGGVSCQPK